MPDGCNSSCQERVTRPINNVLRGITRAIILEGGYPVSVGGRARRPYIRRGLPRQHAKSGNGIKGEPGAALSGGCPDRVSHRPGRPHCADDVSAGACVKVPFQQVGVRSAGGSRKRSGVGISRIAAGVLCSQPIRVRRQSSRTEIRISRGVRV